MNRQEIISQLEAIRRGDFANIARPVPRTYTNKFKDKARLLKELKIVFGQEALIFCQGGQYWAISRHEGVWFFLTNPDGTYCVGDFRPGCIILTGQEYLQICAEIDGKGLVWEEGRTYNETTEP